MSRGKNVAGCANSARVGEVYITSATAAVRVAVPVAGAHTPQYRSNTPQTMERLVRHSKRPYLDGYLSLDLRRVR